MKQCINFQNPKFYLTLLNLLIFNVLAISQNYTCNIAAPANFLTNTNANETVVTMAWTPVTLATGGYRIEVLDASTARRYFETTVGAGVTTATVSITPGHRYLTTIRSICGTGSNARLGLKTNINSADKVIIDDVIFSPCTNNCPGAANADYANLLNGDEVSWVGGEFWPFAPAEDQKKRRSLFLQIKANGNVAGSGEKIRIKRDDGNKSTIFYNEGIDNCHNDTSVTCQSDGVGIKCMAGGKEVCAINFAGPDLIHFKVADNWQVNYRTATCNMPAFANFGEPGEPEGSFTPKIIPEPQMSNAHSLTCAPNPASDNMEINFELLEEEAISLGIYSALGELVGTINDSEKRVVGQNGLSYNVGNLPTGTYFVVLRGARWQSAVRFEKL